MSNIALVRSRPRHGSVRFGGQISRLFLAIELALQVRRERRLLAGFSDGMLKDIGLTRADVDREHGRAFWDVPVDRQ